jgi:hypothetical protein
VEGRQYIQKSSRKWVQSRQCIQGSSNRARTARWKRWKHIGSGYRTGILAELGYIVGTTCRKTSRKWKTKLEVHAGNIQEVGRK